MSTKTSRRPVRRRLWRTARSLATSINQLHIPVTRVTRPIFGALYLLHVAVREGSIWLIRVLWWEPLFRSQCESVGPRLQMEQLPYMTGAGRIVVGADVRLSGKSSIGFASHVHQTPVLAVGDSTFIGHNCTFLVAESITIGRHCLLAGGVRVSDFDGHPLDAAERRRNEPSPPSAIRPVVIGNDVWIGSGAHVLKGVRIGDRSIIGAGSIVTSDVPDDTVAAGDPAGILKALT